jgi:hypothetical protein
MDHALQLEVLVFGEIRDHLLAMLLGRDEHVAVQRLEALQERDRQLVLVDDVVRVLRVPGEQLADEAAARELAAHGLEVDPPTRAHRAGWQPGHQ